MAKIEIKNLNMGGIADSDYLGSESSVSEAVGLDLHSESGLIKVNQKLKEDSGGLVDDLCKVIVACSDGNTYYFGSTNGKVWKRASDGTWSYLVQITGQNGYHAILGGSEYQGYIYYATRYSLGRWQIGTDWSTRNDTWNSFLKGDIDFHPMRIVNQVLYIGDKNIVAQVDAGTFSQNALDIADPLRIKSLGRVNTDLLIGTYVNDNVNATELLRWNTWSVSFSTSDPIPEVGINAFLEMDNQVVVSAGTKGNLYIYDGMTLDLYKTVKGVYTGTKRATVNPNAVFNFGGLPLFGFSNVSDNPAPLGVYCLGRTNRNYPYILSLDFPISTNDLENIEIGAIASINADQFTVSWKKTVGATITYGVDVLDLTTKNTLAYFSTRKIIADRFKLLTFGIVDIGYKSIPDNCSITVQKQTQADTVFGLVLNTVKDTMRNVVSTKVDINDATTLKIRVNLNAHNNDAPEVEVAQINVNME
jgi:hypothetical protein